MKWKTGHEETTEHLGIFAFWCWKYRSTCQSTLKKVASFIVCSCTWTVSSNSSGQVAEHFFDELLVCLVFKPALRLVRTACWPSGVGNQRGWNHHSGTSQHPEHLGHTFEDCCSANTDSLVHQVVVETLSSAGFPGRLLFSPLQASKNSSGAKACQGPCAQSVVVRVNKERASSWMKAEHARAHLLLRQDNNFDPRNHIMGCRPYQRVLHLHVSVAACCQTLQISRGG